jgi:hypothetical protein
MSSDVGKPRVRNFSTDRMAATAPVGLGIARWSPDDGAPTVASTGAAEAQLHAGQDERESSTARTFRVPVTPTTPRPQKFWIKEQLAEEGQGKGPAPPDIDWNFHLLNTLREGDSVEEAMWERFYERGLTHADIKADFTPPDRLAASSLSTMRASVEGGRGPVGDLQSVKAYRVNRNDDLHYPSATSFKRPMLQT